MILKFTTFARITERRKKCQEVMEPALLGDQVREPAADWEEVEREEEEWAVTELVLAQVANASAPAVAPQYLTELACHAIEQNVPTAVPS